MARTLEREEESRIEELERLAREGDGVDKLIAEMQLTEERKGAIEAEGLALQAEADAPKGKADETGGYADSGGDVPRWQGCVH